MTMTGVKLTVVHYRESYVPDMLAGRVQVVFSPYRRRSSKLGQASCALLQ